MNRKKWAIGYVVLCMLYFAVSVFLPHDRLDPRGLAGIGKPSLKLKTQEITNDTELKFEYDGSCGGLLTLGPYWRGGAKCSHAIGGVGTLGFC